MPEDTKYIVNQSQLTAIGTAIREKLNEQTTYTVDEMPGKIEDISGGGSGLSYYRATVTNESSDDFDVIATGSIEIDENNIPQAIIMTQAFSVINSDSTRYFAYVPTVEQENLCLIALPDPVNVTFTGNITPYDIPNVPSGYKCYNIASNVTITFID